MVSFSVMMALPRYAMPCHAAGGVSTSGKKKRRLIQKEGEGKASRPPSDMQQGGARFHETLLVRTRYVVVFGKRRTCFRLYNSTLSDHITPKKESKTSLQDFHLCFL